MRHATARWMGFLAVCAVILPACFAVADAPVKPADTAWDVGLLELFDAPNTDYTIASGRVVVDLGAKTGLCPTGLGQLASGRENVREIELQYTCSKPGKLWLHIVWNPGGSGNEQFEVELNGKAVGKSKLIDGTKRPYMAEHELLPLQHPKGKNILILRHLSGDGLNLQRITLANTADEARLPQTLNPRLKFPSLASYEREIGEKGVLFEKDHVRIYAPQRKEREARILTHYVTRAYEELYRLVGMNTEYKIVVYHFPRGNPNGWGGTSECTIWYSFDNLDFESQEEWTKHEIPHVSGHIEETSHNFAPLVSFGWEMVGWHVSRVVTQKLAANPIYNAQIESTRQMQAETFKRYRSLGNTFPSDIEPNLCDRIHAHLLWECERRYGPAFWADFHKEVRSAYPRLREAECISDPDESRNKRYQIALECLTRLDARHRLLDDTRSFTEMLGEYGISLTRDLKSLHPTDPAWNRKLE